MPFDVIALGSILDGDLIQIINVYGSWLGPKSFVQAGLGDRSTLSVQWSTTGYWIKRITLNVNEGRVVLSWYKFITLQGSYSFPLMPTAARAVSVSGRVADLRRRRLRTRIVTSSNTCCNGSSVSSIEVSPFLNRNHNFVTILFHV